MKNWMRNTLGIEKDQEIMNRMEEEIKKARREKISGIIEMG